MEAVILVGIPGSGKSTFYRERFFDTHVRINLDMLRTRERERILLAACLQAKQPFVVDNTNVLAEERARYIEPAKAAGFRTVGYYFQTELRAAIARNNQRPKGQAIPVPGVIAKHKRLQPPAVAEGFDEIYCVELTNKNEFITAVLS
jgi:predicted kinase